MSNPFKFNDNEQKEIWEKIWKKQDKHTPYFNQIKRRDKSYSPTFGTKVFFDSETYLYYKTPESEPLVIPYLIGVCDEIDRKDSFKYFLSENPTEDFFSYLLGDQDYYEGPNKTLSDKKKLTPKRVKDKETKEYKWEYVATRANANVKLYAFNISYDFHALRLWIEAKYGKHVYINYKTGTDKKFVCGLIKSSNTTDRFGGKVSNIHLKDLWMWDRSKGLGRRINDIRDIVWKKDPVDKDKWIEKLNYREDNNGKKVDDPILDTLLKTIKAYGLDYHTFKKGSLGEDYTKINLHKKGDDYYYWPSKESWEQGQPPKKLDITKEIEYLRIDVMAMPVIEKGEELMRKEAKCLLGIGDKVLHTDHSITAPGFAKYLLEEYSRMFLREHWRVPISIEEYEEMEENYIGAFTASNPNILYFDEDSFKKLYPNISFYDDKGEPRIKAYDINSMYPYVMQLGIPYGKILYEKPEGVEGVDYCTWYCVNFYDAVDPENKIIYDWSDKYKCFNNCFFGRSYLTGFGELTVKEYVLKELYELFDSMCDHKTRVLRECYQRLDMKFMPTFITPLYEAKSNRDNSKTKGQTETCKLMMNSLYGKLAEKYRKSMIVFTNDTKRAAMDYAVELSLNAPRYELELERLSKNKELDNLGDIGFMMLENMTKRFDDSEFEWRESIMPGLYITQKSRWLLLSSVKCEIDNGNLFLNCDTDSMKIVQINPPKIHVHPKEIGAWKYEGSFTHFGHPNMLKKYFLFNMLSKSPKPDKWGKMASGGIPNNKIWPMDVSKEELLNMWKTIYDINNRVVIRHAKNTCKWTKEYHQPVIETVDIEVIGGQKIDITHEVKDNRLYEIK